MWCQSSSNESTVVMNCSFLAILAVMLKGAHALYSLPLEMVPLWNGVSLASGKLMASTEYVPRLENFKP